MSSASTQMASADPRTSFTIPAKAAGIRLWRQAKRRKEAGVRPSMGAAGDACDHAVAESFFSTLDAERLSRRRSASQAALAS